jgi:hypothetical protein
MGVRRLYRVSCDFCDRCGPADAAEDAAVRGAAACKHRIRRVYRCFYGNEVYVCDTCEQQNAEARGWVEAGKEADADA